MRSRLTDEELARGADDIPLCCDTCGAVAANVWKQSDSTAPAYALCNECEPDEDAIIVLTL